MRSESQADIGGSQVRQGSHAPTIAVFDSGLGGLTVFRQILRARPDARFVYVADDAAFPYGALGEDELIARVLKVMEAIIADHAPDLVVIACNTASTLVLPALRARFAIPFVGTVPAVKPACAGSTSKRISVLGTKGTVAREYTHELIRQFASGCDVTLVGSPMLATIAEARLRGEPVDESAIAAEIAPCFIERDGRRTDAVALACTHYPLLIDLFETLAPWPVAWLDPASAIARRVTALIGPAIAGVGTAHARFTSGTATTDNLKQSLAGFGLAPIDAAPILHRTTG